jgi:hypothetical protein
VYRLLFGFRARDLGTRAFKPAWEAECLTKRGMQETQLTRNTSPLTQFCSQGSRAPENEETAVADDDLRRSNCILRDKIRGILDRHPALRDDEEDVALYQDLHVEVGTPFLQRVQGKLQERARVRTH